MKFLTAEWRNLAMINYEADPSLLTTYVPSGTELDSWNGKTFISLVGFQFLNTRVLRMPIPFHRNFEEVNLRFYVRRKGPDGWRRGVVFIKEIVPGWAIAAVARALYNERYVSMPMRHTIREREEGNFEAEYGWRFRERWNSLHLIADPESNFAANGSEEEFIAEHYWGYSMHRDGSTIEYRVEHSKWNVRMVRRIAVDCDVAALYGPQFAEPLHTRPASAFLAEGSAVSVYTGKALS